MKKITIDLDDDLSIESAIQEIEKLKEQIEQFPGYVASREYIKAQDRYREVTMNDGEVDPNTQDITVMYEEQPKKAWIHAVGDDVVFAEYGAGIGIPEVDTTLNGGEQIPTGQGTWSSAEGGEGHIPLNGDRGYWFYYNTWYERINPTYAMTQTVEDIKRDVGQLSQEYFK